MTFHGQNANFPWISQGLWIYSQMMRWGQVAYDEAGLSHVRAAYRPDMYRDALGSSGVAVPAVDSRIEGTGAEKFIDGRTFEPDDIPGYAAGFDIRNGINPAVVE